MRRRGRLWWIASALLGAVAIAAMIELFALRFRSGDVYPPCSSLRSDLVGAGALYDGLTRLGTLRVTRNFTPLDRWRAQGAVLFYLGAGARELTAAKSELVPLLSRLAGRGNRVVVSLEPPQIDDGEPRLFGVKDWALRIEQTKSADGGGALSFEASKDWTVLRTDRGKAVVVERVMGNGSVVLAASSYPFFNQTLAEDRQTELLVRLIGPYRRIVFDESHFGVIEAGSVMGLVRRFRLQGFFAGLLLVAALYIWRQASAFPPPVEALEASRPEAVAGRDSFSGFVNLLRRNFPPRKVLELGWREWKRSEGPRLSRADEAHLDALLRAEPDPLRAYLAMRGFLVERKRLERKSG